MDGEESDYFDMFESILHSVLSPEGISYTHTALPLVQTDNSFTTDRVI